MSPEDPPVKPQLVRLLDVAFIGPAMLLAAAELPRDRPLLALTMAVLGAGTVAYNLANFLTISRRGGG